MRFPNVTEYDVALLAIIVWIMVLIYPAFNSPVELNPIALYLLIPNFTLVPIIWALVKSRINAFLKVFLLFTSWFIIIIVVMVVSAKFGTINPSTGSLTMPGTIVQPVVGAAALVFLLASLRKPKLRWFNFLMLTSYWALYMPKSFNVSWTLFDPSRFFFGDFISFILPMLLYFHLVELRRSESRIIPYVRKHIKEHWKIRAFRLGHFGAYILLIVLAMFLTLDLFFLKLFDPSAYLLMSVELTSPMAWLLLGLVTVSILILAPTAVMFVGQKIKRLISRR